MARESVNARQGKVNARNGMRTKSRMDIRNQLFRISNALQGRDFGDARVDRVWDIADRYEGNIMNTAQYRRDSQRLATSIGAARTANSERLWNRRYPRSVYMR